jgi:hypothetical protein
VVFWLVAAGVKLYPLFCTKGDDALASLVWKGFYEIASALVV